MEERLRAISDGLLRYSHPQIVEGTFDILINRGGQLRELGQRYWGRRDAKREREVRNKILGPNLQIFLKINIELLTKSSFQLLRKILVFNIEQSG